MSKKPKPAEPRKRQTGKQRAGKKVPPMAPATAKAPAKHTLRTLGDVEPDHAPAPKRTGSNAKLAKEARELLEAEFERTLAMKQKLLAEAAVGGKEKGREPARQAEGVRTLIASLEGMSRFALKMGLVTPAESRELYARAMKKGLYDGWR